MATLPENVKARIVQALACYDTPSQVATAVKAEFNLTVTPQQCEAYDPTKAAGRNVGKKFRALFEATRKSFLEDQASIPIANRSVRLRALDKMYHQAVARGNVKLGAQLLEQAAKEAGGAFTNRHKLEHTGKGGGPMQAISTVTNDPVEAAKIYAMLMGPARK
ncbi:DUF2280 domain-containing protein [Paraburkholderia tropica]|uniref:DUF2280 domain-containing protein n=1 Tax=Paraburkholderia tropica TaxID=92647 RepID=UPI003D2C6BA3